MKIHKTKARKDYVCRKCNDPILPGQTYYWFKHRYASPNRRHIEHGYPKPSELTTSDKLAALYGARESCESEVSSLESLMGSHRLDLVYEALDSLKNVLEEAQNDAENTGEEYTSSADNMEEYFAGSYQIDEIREKADACETWRSELEDAYSTLEDIVSGLEDAHDNFDAECLPEELSETGPYDEQVDNAINAANDAIGALEL